MTQIKILKVSRIQGSDSSLNKEHLRINTLYYTPCTPLRTSSRLNVTSLRMNSTDRNQVCPRASHSWLAICGTDNGYVWRKHRDSMTSEITTCLDWGIGVKKDQGWDACTEIPRSDFIHRCEMTWRIRRLSPRRTYTVSHLWKRTPRDNESSSTIPYAKLKKSLRRVLRPAHSFSILWKLLTSEDDSP